MPIPKPTEGENQKEFIARCMSNEVMVREYKDNEQRLAICFSQWKQRNKVDILDWTKFNNFKKIDGE